MARNKDLPGPSEAVHVVASRWRNRSVCGEKELPSRTPVTCPVCREKDPR